VQQVADPKIRSAVLKFLLAALALVVACRATSPSAHEPTAASPQRPQADVPASSTPIPSPAPRDSLPGDARVLADPAPEDAAFHRELSVPSSGPARTLSAKTLAAAVQRNNVASFALWSAFAEHDTFVASPYSIRAALGLVFLASGGQSRKRLQSRLVYPERADDLAIGALDATARAGSRARVESASSLWIVDANRLQPQYLERVANSLHVEVHAVDFINGPERARRFINTWTSTHARGDTTEPFSESTITSRSQAVLVDTMSFDGTWPPRFMLAEGLHAWSDQNGTVGRITMDMAYGGKCKAIFNDPGTASSGDCIGSACLTAVDAAIADYQDSTLSLMVVKPESWKQFIWSENSFLRIWSALRKAPEADFHFPIIKLRSMRDLTQPLLRLGVAASDLSLSQGAVDRAGPKLSLDRIVHQASFQVDAGSPKREPTPYERRSHDERHSYEEGSSPPPPYFTADNAFYFLVLERETGLILLMGQVVEPPPYRSKRERDELAPKIPGATL
jgi:serpin B